MTKTGTPVNLLVKANLNGESASWRSLRDSYPDLLDRLKRLGFFGVEVAIKCTGEPEADNEVLNSLRTWARPWHDAGLQVFVHPYTYGAANPAFCEGATGGTPLDTLRRTADMAATLADAGGMPIKLTYHPAEVGEECGNDPRTARSLYLERSERFFRLSADYIDTFGGLLQLCSETQLPTKAHEKRVRIGDRSNEVLATALGTSAGVCWDTGHYWLSTLWLGSSPQPEEALVERVRHMHIHDVVDERDHRLLNADSGTVAKYVNQAAANGHLSSITLEYDYGQSRKGAETPTPAEILSYLEQVYPLVVSWTQGTPAVQKRTTA